MGCTFIVCPSYPLFFPPRPLTPSITARNANLPATLFWWNSLAYRLRHECQSLQLYSPATAAAPFMIVPTWATSRHGVLVASFLKDVYAVYSEPTRRHRCTAYLTGGNWWVVTCSFNCDSRRSTFDVARDMRNMTTPQRNCQDLIYTLHQLSLNPVPLRLRFYSALNFEIRSVVECSNSGTVSCSLDDIKNISRSRRAR